MKRENMIAFMLLSMAAILAPKALLAETQIDKSVNQFTLNVE